MKKAADGYTNYGKKSGKEDTYTDYAGKTSKPDSYTQYRKGGVVKKAQNGMAKKASDFYTGVKKGTITKASDRKTGMNFDKKGFDSLAKTKNYDSVTKTKPKAKSGGNFGMLSVKAGVDKNPNPTFADKIAGAKKKAMSGMEMMKMGGKAAKQAAIAIAMKKAGKTPKKKMQYGGEAASMVPKGAKKMMKSGGTVSMQLGSYDRQIGKNYTGKNVVNKGAKAKMGKAVMKKGGKCKNGC